jgi:hypothetical protein
MKKLMNKDIQTIIYRYLHRYRYTFVLKEHKERCKPSLYYDDTTVFDRVRVCFRNTNEDVTCGNYICKLNDPITVALLPKRYFYSNGSLKNDSNE